MREQHFRYYVVTKITSHPNPFNSTIKFNENSLGEEVGMMDEQLISEVQQHAIIYNRQKRTALNGDKCVTKDLAWQDVAQRLGSDGKFEQKKMTIYSTS